MLMGKFAIIYLGGIMFKVNNEFANANVSRTVRFTEKLFDKLNQTATKNNVSFNLLVLQCCKYALDNHEHQDITL